MSKVPIELPDAEAVVGRVVEPGEKIVWTGRPDVAVLLRGQTRRGRAPVLAALLAALVFVGVGVPWLGRLGSASQAELVSALVQNGRVPFLVVCAILVGALVLGHYGLDDTSRLIRWAHSLTYGITDRRLLILEGSSIRLALGPEDLGSPRIVPRSPGYDDVLLKERVGGPVMRHRPSRLAIERHFIAFKALPNADEVLGRIESWAEACRRRAEEQVSDFVAKSSDGSATPAGSRQIVNARFGLRCNVPEEWTAFVRWRKKPYGKIFLDNEDWRPIEDAGEWNVLRVEGPMNTSFELHVDEIDRPVTTYQQQMGSTLGNMFGGEILASEEHLERGRFSGYSITRRLLVNDAETTREGQQRNARAQAAMLHDGRFQLGIVTTWPEGSAPLESALDAIADSLVVTG